MAFFSEHGKELGERLVRFRIDKYNGLPNVDPNAGIPLQYTRQSQPGGLIGGDSLSPMQMYQNRNAYQGQYGTPESFAPMQMLNQYRQSAGAESGAAGTPGTPGTPGSTGTTGGK